MSRTRPGSAAAILCLVLFGCMAEQPIESSSDSSVEPTAPGPREAHRPGLMPVAPSDYREPIFGPSATVVTDDTAYATNETIVVNYTGLPQSNTDWIGIYTPTAPDDFASLRAWYYTNGTQTPGPGPGASGTVTFVTPNLVSGTYVARSYANDNYVRIAQSAPFTVALGATVTTNLPNYDQTTPIGVSFTGVPGAGNDWIGIYPSGSPSDGGSLQVWLYTNGTQNFGPGPGPTGMVTFAAGLLNAGTYVARTHTADNFFVIAESAPFPVTGTPVGTIVPNAMTYTTADTILLSYTGAIGTDTDWVGIYASTSPSQPAFLITWIYTNGTQEHGVGPTPDGQVSFNASDLGPGMYIARLYANDSFSNQQAQSFAFSVTP